MKDYKEYFIKCCDKKYIAHTDEYSFKGILLNYNSGNVVLYNEEQETICHIPYRDLKVLIPIKDRVIGQNLKNTNSTECGHVDKI